MSIKYVPPPAGSHLLFLSLFFLLLLIRVFYVSEPPLKPRIFHGGRITRLNPNDEEAIAAAKFAVEASNHTEGKDDRGRLEFKTILRINMRRVKGVSYYITLQASDECFYQAKVLHGFNSTFKLEMFRPAQCYKE
ncbi:Cystatin domain containing protein [Trema orientale]|uniref:Cystatin domain containing protein n=1 Tax=Trema orientale TaxID=63057 RepID=A0A2P5FUY5_TREOI|nr:Cystatin domain containing protein [Trema orientale]